MTEMSGIEALVPDVWRCEPAMCPHGPHAWHAEPHGNCETSCLAPIVIHPQLELPRLWWNDDTERDCG